MLDALVLASTREGSPNVVLEAMSSRTPVLATRVGDVPNLIDDGENGFILPVGDELALAEKLLHLYRLGAEARRSMGAAGRRIVEDRFQLESVTARYWDLYQQLANDAEGGSSRGRRSACSEEAISRPTKLSRD
jgi:glycosyltransferase involved in cell wall biosynthesis